MKKLLFGLLATVMFVCSGNAQTKLSTAKKAAIDAQMITLVHLTAQTTYKSGMSQADFIKQTGPVNPTKEETALLQKLYKYASAGTSDCEIMKGDNSILVTVAQSGTVSETPPNSKFPWALVLQGVIEVIKIIIELIP